MEIFAVPYIDSVCCSGWGFSAAECLLTLHFPFLFPCRKREKKSDSISSLISFHSFSLSVSLFLLPPLSLAFFFLSFFLFILSS